jgi:hypothetical protein
MFFNFRRLKTGAVVVLAMLSMPVAGQDLLARQAPIDKKMRAVDSVALQRLIGDEQLENPGIASQTDGFASLYNLVLTHKVLRQMPVNGFKSVRMTNYDIVTVTFSFVIHDTYFSTKRRTYGTTVAKLCKLNGISRKTMLRPGQIIKYS